MKSLGAAIRSVLSSIDEPCDPRPLAMYRIALYGALALHFGPAIADYEHNFGSSAFSGAAWDPAAQAVLSVFPPTLPALASAGLVLGRSAGVLGWSPRVAAMLSGASSYVLCCKNSLNVQTLALAAVWSILAMWAVLGGGAEALSIRRARSGAVHVQYSATRTAIALQVQIGLLLAGVEKIRAGWPSSNEMGVLLRYPAHTITRAWVGSCSPAISEAFGGVVSWLTLAVELLVPVALLSLRTRKAAVVVGMVFFATIAASLQVPPLFVVVYGGGLALWWQNGVDSRGTVTTAAIRTGSGPVDGVGQTVKVYTT